jgi:hypothetical protein
VFGMHSHFSDCILHSSIAAHRTGLQRSWAVRYDASYRHTAQGTLAYAPGEHGEHMPEHRAAVQGTQGPVKGTCEGYCGPSDSSEGGVRPRVAYARAPCEGYTACVKGTVDSRSHTQGSMSRYQNP